MWVAKFARLDLLLARRAGVRIGPSRVSCSKLKVERQVQLVDLDPGNRMAFGCLPTQGLKLLLLSSVYSKQFSGRSSVGPELDHEFTSQDCCPTIDDLRRCRVFSLHGIERD